MNKEDRERLKIQQELFGFYVLMNAAVEKYDNLPETLIRYNFKRTGKIMVKEAEIIGAHIGNLIFQGDPTISVTITDLCIEIVRQIFGGNGEYGFDLDDLPKVLDVIHNLKETLNSSPK